VTSRSRTVWIVGEVRTEFDDQRFHRRDCYVLDQVSNRGRERSVERVELPPNYGPCQICAPGRRDADRSVPQTKAGVQPGSTVVILNPATGSTSELRLVRAGEPIAPGVLSATSPLGRALIGRAAGDEVRYETPRGESRRARIVELRTPA
jgi:hypothetical protein